MSDLALDTSTWDLDISNGDLYLLDSQETVRQLLRQRLSMFLGEWFLDSSLGVPYFEDILKKGASLEIVDSILKTTVLETVGIEDLEEFFLDFEPVDRTFTVTFKARTREGVIDFSEEITI